MKCCVFHYVLFSSFSVCVYIDEKPSGLVFKFKQNSVDDFSVVSFMFQNQVIIRTFQVTVYPGRTIRYKLTLPVDPTPWWQWIKHHHRLYSISFSCVWYSHYYIWVVLSITYLILCHCCHTSYKRQRWLSFFCWKFCQQLGLNYTSFLYGIFITWNIRLSCISF